MEINLEVPQGHLFIHSVTAEGIRIKDTFYLQPLILSTRQLISDWSVTSFRDIKDETLQVIFNLQPEVVLIGCGQTQVFLPPATQGLFLSRGIGLEVMTTGAACRTFNLLAAEGRDVVAALLPE